MKWLPVRKGKVERMLGINARVEDLREQIIKEINQAHVPACIADYVLTEIINDVRAKRLSEIQKERRLYRDEKKAEAVEVGEPVPGEVPVAKKEPVAKDTPEAALEKDQPGTKEEPVEVNEEGQEGGS